ncbi:hypothetical protein N0B31_20025 [Salinirubellus salinus]|uniref:DUF7982 domain-containing protein n=1 Tax=Salinirubellus salinus TaxID=1364945 RepID=A0A9E7UAM0_9EURY|nr:hypothetical protein [Salinirubellus salinus]UWM54393.1 hypothetical protein N0B31_20025 [Salinirubellus salinus]
MSSNRIGDERQDEDEQAGAEETEAGDTAVGETGGNESSAPDGATSLDRRVGTVAVAGDGDSAAWLSASELRAGVSQTTASMATHRRRIVLGFVSFGVLALVVGLIFPGVRVVMLALGGIGLSGALLTTTLVPGSPVPTGVGSATYSALADSGGALVAELGLSDLRVYVRTERGSSAVRLFVPQTTDYVVPSDEALEHTLVVTDDERERGVSVQPTGESLFNAYAGMLAEFGTDSPDATIEQLMDALTEQFGLADSITVSERTDQGITLRVSGSAYGSLEQFDHPVPSFIATGLARRLDRPVRLTVRTGRLGEGTSEVVCEWDGDAT